MTSKHLFFKAMREDLRHKTWMLALSVLGSFLILPVAWLLVRDNMGTYTDTALLAKNVARETLNFFEEYMTLLGAFFTAAGAVIVGLWGFRFLHHKNMVDTWHSMPIKRNTLFGVCWLNGFLLWLVPFFTALLITCLMAAGTLISVGATESIGAMLATAGISFVALLIEFLLIYNLILVAVMLSGNILNTLVSMAILGFGAIGIYGLCIGFFSTYMDTFYVNELDVEKVAYFSPLFSAGYVIYARIEYVEKLAKLWTICGVNLLIVIGLSVASWALYRKRSSELAEQGIKNKPLIALMKLIVGIAAGMCGWILLSFIVNKGAFAWGIFGCVLVTVVVFGIMDIIFHMDFKAFYRHKLQMGITVAASLLMCFGFCFDWIGYDTYLPDKDEIVEIAVYSTSFRNGYSRGNTTDVLDRVQIQDVDAAYAFLERMIANTENRYNGEVYGGVGYVSSEIGYIEYTNIPVRVGLKNGTSYYRYYAVSNYDEDVLWPLISSEAYLLENYALSEEAMEYCCKMHFERYDSTTTLSDRTPKEHMVAIMEAYNRDLFADPENVIANTGKLLVQVRIDYEVDGWYCEVFLDVYESMSNTVAAMKELGYGKWVEDMDVSEIEEIRLGLGAYPDADVTPEQLVALARSQYGVYLPGQTEQNISEILYRSSETVYDYEIVEKVQVATVAVEYQEAPYISITDKEEIEELLSLMSYTGRFRTTLFAGRMLQVDVVNTENEYLNMRIPMGVLPEKYIQRFGELNVKDFAVNTQDWYME